MLPGGKGQLSKQQVGHPVLFVLYDVLQEQMYAAAGANNAFVLDRFLASDSSHLL